MTDFYKNKLKEKLEFKKDIQKLFDPSKLETEKTRVIHNILLRHGFNLYSIYMINAPKEEIDSILILRPANHNEVKLIDKNYKEKLLPNDNIPCPCIILTNGKILSVAFPTIEIAGINWRDELPSFTEWLKEQNNTCKLCGINIIFKNTEYCCKFHDFMFKETNMDFLNSNGWNLKQNIL